MKSLAMRKIQESRTFRCPASSARWVPSSESRQQDKRIRQIIQPKLTLGAVNDKYEQEADHVADKVMRMRDADVAKRVESGTVQPMLIQRMCPECEGELAQRQPVKDDEEEKLQAKEATGQVPQLGSGVEARITTLKSGGQPLDRATRSFFEPRFGHDFSGVRVHHNGQAADIARSIHARAFTLGSDVVFGAGQYSPASDEGRRLLGHELTHVIQQGAGSKDRVQRVTDEELGMRHETRSGAIGAPAPATTPAATSGPEITLETGNIGAGYLNNKVHQQICVKGAGSGSERPDRKRCFSFAAVGAQWPQFSRKWLGWNSLVVGAIIKGQVYEPSPVPGATVVGRHYPTHAQANRWLLYMDGWRLGLQDGYSVARHNCRTFSQWEFRDAPIHW